MKLRIRKRRKPIIPINSMSDIAFLLLIFIMLLSLINYKKEIKIEYAKAEYQEATQLEKNFEIWIDSGGNTYHNGKLMQGDVLADLIREKYDKDPYIRFHIIADKNADYNNVNNVIEMLKDVHLSAVSLVVKENN